MEMFAIICLCIILISIQHLMNWLWRIAFKPNSNFEIGAVIFSLFGLLFSWICLLHIILWTYPLIK